MNPILVMALKDLRLLFRDKLGAFFIIGFPILMGLFFGCTLDSGGTEMFPKSGASCLVFGENSYLTYDFTGRRPIFAER